MKKNIFSLILGLMMIFSFTACSTSPSGDTETPTEIIDDTNDTIVKEGFLTIEDYINDNKCDQVIDKEFSTGRTMLACYDYRLKSSTYVGYILDGDLVNSNNIEERPYFYSELDIIEEYQSEYSDWTNSGYDRGHLPPDASFDYNKEDLNEIYSLAFIIPQDPNVNRYQWTDVEQYARDMAVILGELIVINGVIYDDNPERIGENQIAVPSGFYKILMNENADFKECYFYTNYVLGDADLDRLENHKVNCVQYENI